MVVIVVYCRKYIILSCGGGGRVSGSGRVDGGGSGSGSDYSGSGRVNGGGGSGSDSGCR